MYIEHVYLLALRAAPTYRIIMHQFTLGPAQNLDHSDHFRAGPDHIDHKLYSKGKAVPRLVDHLSTVSTVLKAYITRRTLLSGNFCETLINAP